MSYIKKILSNNNNLFRSAQETLQLSPFVGTYNIVVQKDNMLRQINELVDFRSGGRVPRGER